MPKVSIILPAFNAARSIGATLDSILAQTMPDLEVVCVNDGSTDDTESCIERYMRTDSRIRCLSFRQNSKSVIARKRGVMDAVGEFIMFVDADDLLVPDACEKLLALMESTQADVLQFALRLETEQTDDVNPTFESFFAAHDLNLTAPDILPSCFIRHRFSHNLCNKICRADLCRKAFAAMPDCRLHDYEDMYALFFVLYHASTFRSVPTEPLYLYRFRGIDSYANPTPGQFEELCSAMRMFPLLEHFLLEQDTLDLHRYVLDAMKDDICRDALTKLLTVSDLSPDLIRIAYRSFGADILYDLLEKIGLTQVQDSSRLGLIDRLTEYLRES
jgi:glycosyltransferase involved in cell wall biosynthesis